MSDYVRFVPVISTTAVLFGGLVFSFDATPPIQYPRIPEVHEIKGLTDCGGAQTQYKVKSGQVDTFQKIDSIHKFASNLLENIEDLDPDFSKAIDENYWDLI